MNTLARVVYREDISTHEYDKSITTRGMDVESARKKFNKYAKRILKEFNLDALNKLPEGGLSMTGDTVCAWQNEGTVDRVALSYEEYEVPEILEGCHSYYRVVYWAYNNETKYERWWRPDIADYEESQLFATKAEAQDLMDEWMNDFHYNDNKNMEDGEVYNYSWVEHKNEATGKRSDGMNVKVFIEKVIL